MGTLNIIELEEQKNQLNEQLNSCSSVKQKVLLIYNFYEKLDQVKDEKLKEVYLTEYINEYLNCFTLFNPLSMHPKPLQQIINQLTIFESKSFLKNYHKKIQQLKQISENKLKKLESILAGELYESEENRKIFFPVLEKESYLEFLIFSSLESITIQIERSKNSDSFLVIPRERELEERIEKQINDSWNAAINFSKKYIKKLSPYHKVFIYFDKMQGIYTGNSLGIALTLGFIEELLKQYNAPTVVNIKEKIAFTGGMGQNGIIGEVTKEIIEKKTECVFFSPIETFVVHNNDEIHSLKKLQELNKEFPKRKLEIVGVASLNDLLNRRNLVDIRKQHPLQRINKAAQRNILSLILAVILAVFIYSSGLWDFDDNPAKLFNDRNILHIKNRNNKTLWTKEMVFDIQTVSGNIIPFSQKIVDVDNDGINEVIICNELLYDKEIRTKFGRVVCLNNNQEIVWENKFIDSIYTLEFPHSITYRNNIIDTFMYKTERALLLFAGNLPLYPNAVYKLNLRTGERIDSSNIFWHAGSITSALLGDFDKNGIEELVAVSIHNGYERAVIFSIDVDKLYGQSPAPKRYTFKNIPLADFNSYILLPITDYGKSFFRYNSPVSGSLSFFEVSNEFHFILVDGVGMNTISFNYRFSNTLNFIRLDCSDDAQQKRDSLVARGILKPPFTNTNEYYQMLRDQLRYWDGKKFVKEEEINNFEISGLPNN